MVELIGVGIVAGFLAGISPCILPVLPVVLVAGASRPASDQTPAGVPRADLARSLAVIGGLVLSFSIVVLAGSEILSLLHLPQDALREAGIVLLAVVGLGYLSSWRCSSLLTSWPGCSVTSPVTPPRCRARRRSASSSTRSPVPRTPR